MKNLFLVVTITFLFSEQLQYKVVEASKWNDVWGTLTNQDINFKYDKDEDIVYMYVYDIMYTSTHLLDKKSRETLSSIIDKYFEWNEKAISKEVEIKKNIEIDLDVRGVFKLGDEWYWSSKIPSSSIQGKFFSQNVKRHQLLLIFGKIQASSNEYMDHKPETLYLDFEEAVELKKALSQDLIDEVILKIEKQKAIENEFN